MKLKWLGHSCFLISSETGLRIITDPYPQGNGLSYAPINETADIVIVSHDHFDHNNVAAVPGKYEIITGSGIKTVKGIQFKGIDTLHDESQGRERGANTIFCFSVDGVKLCHLGDLGHRLNKEQIAQIGEVDILLTPIGGLYTIDAKMASTVSDDLKPKVVIPMHCKTPKCNWPLNTVEDFLAGKNNVKKLLPESTEIMVLQPAL